MPRQSKPCISSRKQPRQARSRRLVAEILAAAGRILAREGARRFTAARVAEEAGISVGSLYQYFPNKQAILFRLQSDEWRETGGLLTGILADASRVPFDRLRAMVREFIRTECDEAKMRVALDDAASHYLDAPEARAHHRDFTQTALTFMGEVLPHAAAAERTLVAELLKMTLSAVGKEVSEGEHAPGKAEAMGRALGDMFCAYLETFRPSTVKRQSLPLREVKGDRRPT
jgi:AcrR family transcriptional regulator